MASGGPERGDGPGRLRGVLQEPLRTCPRRCRGTRVLAARQEGRPGSSRTRALQALRTEGLILRAYHMVWERPPEASGERLLGGLRRAAAGARGSACCCSQSAAPNEYGWRGRLLPSRLSAPVCSRALRCPRPCPSGKWLTLRAEDTEAKSFTLR